MNFDIEKVIKTAMAIQYDFSNELFFQKPITADYSQRKTFAMREPTSIYKILTSLAMIYPDRNFAEVGCYNGMGTLAYLYGNPKAEILAIDHKRRGDWMIENKNYNVDYVTDSCFTHKFDKHFGVMLIDLSHNGKDEAVVMKNLEECGMIKDCIMVFDDIYFMDSMTEFWKNLDYIQKYDVTKYGHYTGTGIVVV